MWQMRINFIKYQQIASQRKLFTEINDRIAHRKAKRATAAAMQRSQRIASRRC